MILKPPQAEDVLLPPYLKELIERQISPPIIYDGGQMSNLIDLDNLLEWLKARHLAYQALELSEAETAIHEVMGHIKNMPVEKGDD